MTRHDVKERVDVERRGKGGVDFNRLSVRTFLPPTVRSFSSGGNTNFFALRREIRGFSGPPRQKKDQTRDRSGLFSPEDARTGVLQHEVLVRELVTVDALPARAVVIREVPSLAHESGYDAMEGRSIEAESLLAFDDGR